MADTISCSSIYWYADEVTASIVLLQAFLKGHVAQRRWREQMALHAEDGRRLVIVSDFRRLFSRYEQVIFQ